MNNKTKNENRSDVLFGLIITAVATVIGIVGLICHEPWYEEAQPYLVGRDASWYEVIFTIPHYEGHPPLWHMLIKLASCLGLSYELTIKGVQFIFFEAMIIMLELRSPFSRVTKALLPTSFFVIYHYCVLSRPYAMLMFAGLLCASFYNDRREKPLPYILSMVFLCLCHSYGIAFAGGIALADIAGGMIRERSFRRTFSELFANKKLFIGYAALLAAAIAIILDIAPKQDTMAVHLDKTYSYPVVLLLCFIFIPSEVFVTSFSSDASSIQDEANTIGEMVGAGAVSLIIWAVIFIVCKNRRMIAEMIIPYLCAAVIMSIYAYPHHYGMFLLYVIFIMWTASAKEPIKLAEFTDVIKKSGISEKFAKTCIVGGAAVSVAVNIYWDIYSYANDIIKPYDNAPAAAEWIKDMNIEGSRIMIAWMPDDTNIYPDAPVTLNAYFDKNLYYNMEGDVTYVTHIIADEEEMEADRAYARTFGAPDYVICSSPVAVSPIIESLGFEGGYIAEAFSGTAYRPFKDKLDEKRLYIICTKDKYKELYGKDYEVSSYKKG